MSDQLGESDGRVAAVPDGHDPGDDFGKPQTPTKLTKPSWKYIARKTLREFSDDQAPTSRRLGTRLRAVRPVRLTVL
jgi:hypothetical protein